MPWQPFTLLKPHGTPILIHAERTAAQAQYLMQALKDFSWLQPARHVNLGKGQADALAIQQTIGKMAQSLPGRIGMNYTGGTKVISVHAYRAVEAMQPQAIFSYLDSNTLEMTLKQARQLILTFSQQKRCVAMATNSLMIGIRFANW